jgi:T5orf172 domain
MRVWFSGPRIFGIRTGISLGREDLAWLKPAAQPLTTPSDRCFIYVIKGEHNLIKVGVSSNPNARIAQLRTASAFLLEFAYLAVLPGDAGDVEAATHVALSRHSLNCCT